MDTIELKSELHRLIERASDTNLLQAIKVILSKDSDKSGDWANEISDALKNQLTESIREADEGEILSHVQAVQEIKERYNL